MTAEDLGGAERVRTGASHTAVIGGEGDRGAIAARRAQVQRQYEAAPPNIEQDKLRERLAKLSGGTAVLYAGGVTPVEQKRRIQLIEDSLNAVRAAAEDGVVAGGGSALAQIAPVLDAVERGAEGDVLEGVRLVRSVLTRPLWRIATNAGQDADEVVAQVSRVNGGFGYDAANGAFVNMYEAGIVDPVARHGLGAAQRRLGRDPHHDDRDADRRCAGLRGPDRRAGARRRGGETRPRLIPADANDRDHVSQGRRP